MGTPYEATSLVWLGLTEAWRLDYIDVVTSSNQSCMYPPFTPVSSKEILKTNKCMVAKVLNHLKRWRDLFRRAHLGIGSTSLAQKSPPALAKALLTLPTGGAEQEKPDWWSELGGQWRNSITFSLVVELETFLNELLLHHFSNTDWNFRSADGLFLTNVKSNWSHQVKRQFCGDVYKCSQAQTQHQRKKSRWYKGSWLSFLIPNISIMFCFLILPLVAMIGLEHLRTSPDLHLRPITAFIWCCGFELSCCMARPSSQSGPFTTPACRCPLYKPTSFKRQLIISCHEPCCSRKRTRLQPT